MSNQEISFVLKSNLDKIVVQANQLSSSIDNVYRSFKRKNVALSEQNVLENNATQGIKNLSNEYQNLEQNLSGVINKSGSFNQLANDSDNRIKKIQKSLKDYNDQISKNKQVEEQAKKIRKFEENFIKTIKKMLDSIHRLGAELTIASFNLKPFGMDFLSGFSFNPKQFFGFGQAMQDAFNLMKQFQQMRHELAYLSDASGDASKALSLVYEIAGDSAISSGTAQGVLKTLSDQGILAGKSLKELGVLSGNLQAATGIAASQWAAFTGELSFNYGLTSKGVENISSALVGTNLRGAQLERTMQSVNKILQTTGFISGVPTQKSIEGLSKKVGGAVKQFQALGISAEKATGFIEGIMDPENFEKNSFLFAKLGISASEYAGYLNDADGQQKLLQKTMSNLPQLASEIAGIQNPFARMQLAKTLGLDMQMIQKMAGKTQGEIEELLKKHEADNKANEALEAKKKRMASEAAKFDDMILGLKMKVLAPVMKFLNSGFLQRFIGVLPTIAEKVGSIFEAMTPIIDSITNALLSMVPTVVKLINEVVNPFIKLFPKFLEFFLSKLPFFDLKKGNKEGAPGDRQTEGENLINEITNVAEYLGKIYLILVAWKGLNALGDVFRTIVGVINPRSKKIINATVGDLADAINSGGSGFSFKNMSFATKALGSAGLIYGAGKIAKEYLPGTARDPNRKDFSIDTANVAERTGQRGMATVLGLLNKSKGGAGPDMGTNLLRQAKVASGRAFDFKNAIPGDMPDVPPKVLKNISNFSKAAKVMKGFSKGLGPLGLALTATQIFTAENKEDFGGAVGGAIGGVLGGMAGTMIAPFLGPLAPLGPILGSAAGGYLGDILGSTVGRVFDMLDKNKEMAQKRSVMLKDTFEKGVSGIFTAFKAGKFENLAKLLSLSLENLYLQAKSKVLSFVPFVGNDKAAARKIAENVTESTIKVMGVAGNSLEQIESTKIAAEMRIRDLEKKGLSTLSADVLINRLNTAYENEKLMREIAKDQLAETKINGKKTDKVIEGIKDLKPGSTSDGGISNVNLTIAESDVGQVILFQ